MVSAQRDEEAVAHVRSIAAAMAGRTFVGHPAVAAMPGGMAGGGRRGVARMGCDFRIYSCWAWPSCG